MKSAGASLVAGLVLASCNIAPSNDSHTAPRNASPIPVERTTSGVPALSDAAFRLQPPGSLGLSGGETKLQIGYALQIRHGADEPAKGTYSETINSVDEGGSATIVFTRDGLPDDSVQTEQHVVEARIARDGRASVTGYGVRYRCWRGASNGSWTKGACP